MGIKQRIQSWRGSHASIDEDTKRRTATTIPCGICKRRYSTANLDKLFAHLGGHFDMRHRLNRCHDCRINFVTEDDLEDHLELAEEQHTCGYLFEHRERCIGHHPQHHGGSKDDNRFDFCYRVRGWEYAQLGEQLPNEQEARASHHRRTSTLGSLSDFVKLHLRKSSTTSTSPPSGSRSPRASTSTNHNPSTQQNIHPQVLLDTVLLHFIPTASIPLLTSLLSAGASPKSITDTLGFTPMHYAAQYGTPETARLLLQHGASLSTPDREGDTPLLHAIRKRNIDLVHFFLTVGKVEVSGREIELSVETGDVEVAGKVLKCWRHHVEGREVNEWEDLDDVLIKAVIRGDEGMVKELVEHGARADVAKDGNGKGVLEIAREMGKMGVLKVLRETEAVRPVTAEKPERIYLHQKIELV